MKHVVVCAMVSVALCGCIREPARALVASPAVAPPSAASVRECEDLRWWHNAWTIASTVLAGAGSAGGAVVASDNDRGVREGAGIGAALAGMLAATSTLAAGIDASSFAARDCEAVLAATVAR